MNVINKIQLIITILLASTITYFVIPLILFEIMDSKIASIICVLLINVIYSFVISLKLIRKFNFSFITSILLGLLFIPFSLVLYKLSTVIYFVLYIIVSLVAQLIYYKYSKKE